jgi:WD40 repeat protein
MPILVRCPGCGVKQQYADRLAGQTIPCKRCGDELAIPRGKVKAKKSSGGSPILWIAFGLGGLFLVGGGIAAVVVVASMQQTPAVPVAAAPQGVTPPIAVPPAAAMPGMAPPVNPVIAGNSAPAGVPPAGVTPPAAGSSTTPPMTAQVSGFVPAGSKEPAGPTPSGFKPASVDKGGRLVYDREVWTITPDPPVETAPLTSTKPLKLKLGSGRLNDDLLVYPVTRGPFAAIRQGKGFGNDGFELYNLTSGAKAGSVPGVPITAVTAVSPNGQYFAMSQSGQNSITVYDVQAKKPLGELPTARANEKFRVAVLGIPRPDRLVGISYLERGIKVWDLPSGNFVTHVLGTDKFQPDPVYAFSPGGKYLAGLADYLAKRIEIFNLDDGSKVASLQPQGKFVNCTPSAVAFSADGSEFAFLQDVNGSGSEGDFSQFTVWNVATGEITSDFDIKPSLKEQLQPGYQRERLDPFPSGRRWLVHSAGILDRDQQALIFSYPKVEQDSLRNARRVMADDWLVAVATGDGDARLETLSIDEAAVAVAKKNFEVGGMAIDADLPPLSAADFQAADAAIVLKEWKYQADPAPEWGAFTGTIPLGADGGIVRDVVVSTGAAPVVGVRVAVDENLQDPQVMVSQGQDRAMHRTLRTRPTQAVARKTTLEAYSLTDGQRQARGTLPFSGSLLGLSPNGKLALVEHHRGQGRLDLFEWGDEWKPVRAWRPYRTAKEERHRAIYQAGFVDDDHVVTVSSEGILVVWRLDTLTPLFRIDEVNGYALSPGGKTLAILRGNSIADKDLAWCDSHTGEGLGTIPVQGMVSGLAFHPRGDRLALSHGDDSNRTVSILNLADGTTQTSFAVPDLAERLDWIGDDYLLFGGQQLISLPLQAVVWSYDVDKLVGSQPQPTGRVIFAQPAGKTWKLRTVTPPHADLVAKLDPAKLANLALVKPGETVSYTLTIPDDPELASVKQVAHEFFQGALERAEMKVATTPQGIQVVAELSLKKLDNVQLSKIGDFRATETVQRKELHWTIRYRQGNQELWKVDRVVGNLDRFLVRLADGEAAQTGVDRQMAESMVERLKGLTLPKFVFGPAARGGLGHSPLAALP